MTRDATSRLVSSTGSRSQALVLASTAPTGLAYTCAFAAHPVSLTAFVVTLGLVVGQAGLLGALVVVAGFLATCTSAARSGGVRRALDRCFVERARRRREGRRRRSIAHASTGYQLQYAELWQLITSVERTDPAEARRLELEDLLDQFVRLAAEHQRCTDALQLAESRPLPSEPPPERRVPRDVAPPPDQFARARAITERRTAHRDECRRRTERLADELEAIDQMVRLVAQRIACPQPDDNTLDAGLERRLWELDEAYAAYGALSA